MEGRGVAYEGVLCWTVESEIVPILHYALKSNGIGIGGQGSIRSGVYQIRVQTLHNKPFGMRVNGHGTSCY